MSNVLSEEKKQQVIALGKLGWPLRRIELATGVRRETAGGDLKAAGIAVPPPGAWGRRSPSKPTNEVTTDFNGEFPLDLGLEPPNSNLQERAGTLRRGGDALQFEIPIGKEKSSRVSAMLRKLRFRESASKA